MHRHNLNYQPAKEEAEAKHVRRVNILCTVGCCLIFGFWGYLLAFRG